nr:MAG TPA: hypothetical protein [Caudoviricetes sp.]
MIINHLIQFHKNKLLFYENNFFFRIKELFLQCS